MAPITVSRVLTNPELVSEATRNKVLAAIDAAGFVPNRLASSMRSAGRLIGIVVSPLSCSGVAEQVRGVSDACQAEGYSVLLVQAALTPEAEEQAVRTLLGWRPAGVILPSFVQSEAVRQVLIASGAPVVELGEIKGHRPIDRVVGISNVETAYAMTMHLATKGYGRIGYVSPPIEGDEGLYQRRAGYVGALADLGIAYAASLETEAPDTAEGGATALVRLLEGDPAIDAIFFASDTLAIGAVQECHRRGWALPGRVGIVGYGDTDLARQLYPPLTTVKVDGYEMGRRAVRCLLDRLAGNIRVPTITSMGFEIVDRDTA